MYTMPNSPHSVKNIFKDSVDLWKKSFFKLMPLVLLAILIGNIPSFFIPELNTQDLKVSIKFIEENVAFVLLYAVIMMFFFAAIITQLTGILRNEKFGFCQVLYSALKCLPYLLLAVVIYEIVIITGLLLFIVPGIVLIVLLSMYYLLIIVDKENPFTAFKHSWKLVTDNWWHTFMVLLIMYGVFLLITLFIDWIAIDLWNVLHPRGGAIWVGHHLIRMTIGIIFYPFICSTLLVLLHDLKLRKEGGAQIP